MLQHKYHYQPIPDEEGDPLFNLPSVTTSAGSDFTVMTNNSRFIMPKHSFKELSPRISTGMLQVNYQGFERGGFFLSIRFL